MKISLQEKYEWDGKSENVKTFRWINQGYTTTEKMYKTTFILCKLSILYAHHSNNLVILTWRALVSNYSKRVFLMSCSSNRAIHETNTSQVLSSAMLVLSTVF
jgi:hypothetical protein